MLLTDWFNFTFYLSHFFLFVFIRLFSCAIMQITFHISARWQVTAVDQGWSWLSPCWWPSPSYSRRWSRRRRRRKNTCTCQGKIATMHHLVPTAVPAWWLHLNATVALAARIRYRLVKRYPKRLKRARREIYVVSSAPYVISSCFLWLIKNIDIVDEKSLYAHKCDMQIRSGGSSARKCFG